MNKSIIEKEILGSVMLNFTLVDKFLTYLKASDFSDTRHKNIYKLFYMLAQANYQSFNATDAYTINPKLFHACGGFEYIAELIGDCVTTARFSSNCDALIKYSTIEALKNLSATSEKFFAEGFNKGISFVESSFENIMSRVHKAETVDLYKAFKDSLNSSNKENVDFKFSSLHNVMGYPRPGELLIIGARPGMGKTAFALACLFNYICCEKKRAVMFSLEMSGTELFQRMISSISAIPLQDIRAGKLTDAMKKCLDDNAKELASSNYLSLYDKTVSTIPALRAAIRKEQKKGDVGLVIVDYLQLLKGNGTNSYEKVTDISRELKLLAREFNCCVVALSQLSRKVEDRSDKRPQLADLRESGSIEQDADYVLFLYRHNYYVKDPNVDPTNEALNVEVAKNRHGKTGTVQLTFDLTTGRFIE